jgi:CubicO group peptidase (beta-lactamase class C family)
MELAFGGFNAVLRDYARFGQLMLNEGAWNGEQIVPREWLRAATVSSAPPQCAQRGTPDGLGYGYQWWIPMPAEGDYLAIGIYNQFVYVNPLSRVVIAKSSAYPNYNQDGLERELESIAVLRAIAAGLAARQ